MERYAHTTWIVKPGNEDEFVRRWDEFTEWSAVEGLRAEVTLLRDVDRPNRFISFGPWETIGAIAHWQTVPGYREHVGRLGELLDDCDPVTVELVAEH